MYLFPHYPLQEIVFLLQEVHLPLGTLRNLALQSL